VFGVALALLAGVVPLFAAVVLVDGDVADPPLSFCGLISFNSNSNLVGVNMFFHEQHRALEGEWGRLPGRERKRGRERNKTE
jgi:hypothetical protein